MNEIALRLAAKIFDRAVIENQYRSAFVEAMLEPVLEPYGWRYSGTEWRGCDFKRVSDKMGLEVKQSAATQTWSDGTIIPRPVFDIAKRKGYYEGSKWFANPGRYAEIYLFAWHPVVGKTADHRNPNQWEFYILPTHILPDGNKKIALSRIKALLA
ncbi:MAG TPA: hypothetical protein VHV26_08070 [Rhizomicrobium sp.]|jgi:hypothetical protein|nr:hypothetical protein [Rhizomicrobium sp.]